MRAFDHAILIVAAMSVLVAPIGCEEPQSPPAAAPPADLDASAAVVPEQPVTPPPPAAMTTAQRLVALPPDVPDPVNQSDQPPPARAAEALAEARRLTAEGQTVEAIRAYERADRFAPSHPVIQRELGLACYDANRPGRAMAHLLRAAQTNPDHLLMQVVLARLYQGDDQTDAAMVACRTALKCTGAAPDSALSAEALYRLAELLESAAQ
ncbi:MAG: tetratricopeptide repeat protein, partial [Planctomycetota bacterium]